MHQPAPPSVLSWNMLYTNDAPVDVALLNAGADVVALQECTPPQMRLLDESTALHARYPYFFFPPKQLGHDTCMLSAHPILAQGSHTDPSLQWARLDLGGGHTLLLLNTHLNSADFSTAAGLIPTRYDASWRDEQIRRLRMVIDPLLQHNEPVLLVGDFNTTEREVAYHEIGRGLIDAHRAVGWGLGHSWHGKPTWPLGLLRIDYQWGSLRVTPLHLTTDCTPHGSDHCMLRGDFAVQ